MELLLVIYCMALSSSCREYPIGFILVSFLSPLEYLKDYFATNNNDRDFGNQSALKVLDGMIAQIGAEAALAAKPVGQAV